MRDYLSYYSLLKMLFQDIQTSLDDHRLIHKELYSDVLKQITAATRCHTCDYKMPVCFLGYVGRHCSKSCWKSVYYDSFDNCRFEDCEFCLEDLPISLANSKYHSMWKKAASKTGYYWPMCNPSVLCNNECIKNKYTIAIPGYNC